MTEQDLFAGVTEERRALYRQDLAALKALDPGNLWAWKLERVDGLPEPAWTCTVVTSHPDVRYVMGTFRNAARGDVWEVVPIDPPFNRYAQDAPIALEPLGDSGTVAVIDPLPSGLSTIADVAVFIREWVERAIEDGIHN